VTTDVERRYRRPDSVLFAELEGEEVLLNPDTGIYHLVNATGRHLLERMDDGDTLSQAIDSLSGETGEDATRVRGDAVSFVEAMTARGLLERVDD
jgi:coenzyme PQQ synthesis protein D (PqqD)